MLPIQRYVFISSRGPISDSPVIMTFMLEVDRGHEVLLTASAEISESKGSISPYNSYGQLPDY